MPTGVASSVIPNFDTQEAVSFAVKNNLDAVQPFINDQLRDEGYRLELISKLKKSELDVVLHLPNMDKLQQADIDAASEIVFALLPRQVRVLVHYEEGMTVDNVPVVAENRVGIENSKTGRFPFDEHCQHVIAALELARKAGSFFVWDPGRMMYDDGETPIENIQNFIVSIINSLYPGKDVVHMADKAAWNIRFREGPLAFPRGIGRFMVSALQDFHLQGGTIIFEHEDAQMALDSIKFFET